MSLALINRPRSGIPESALESEGPEYVDIALLGRYYDGDARKQTILAAVHEESASLDIGGTLSVFKIEPSGAPAFLMNGVARTRWEWFWDEVELDNAGLRIGEARGKHYCVISLPLNSPPRSYLCPAWRSRPFPLKRVLRRDLESVLDADVCVAEYKDRFVSGAMSQKEWNSFIREMVQAGNKVGKSFADYLGRVFPDGDEGWSPVDRGSLWECDSSAARSLCIDDLFASEACAGSQSGGGDGLFLRNALSTLWGSYQEQEGLARESARVFVTGDKAADGFEHEIASRWCLGVFDYLRKWGSRLMIGSCALLSLIPAYCLHQDYDLDAAYALPAILGVDLLVREVGAKISGKHSAPGIVGSLRSLTQYVCGRGRGGNSYKLPL